MLLLENSSEYIFVLQSNHSEDEAIAFNKTNASLTLTQRPPLKSDDKSLSVEFIVGTLIFKTLKLLVYCKSSTNVGTLFNKKVFKVSQLETLEASTEGNFSPQEKLSDSKAVKMVQAILKSRFLYFSKECDLTNSAQRLFSLAEKGTQSFMTHFQTSHSFGSIDVRFLWNRHLTSELKELNALHFSVPLLNGFFESYSDSCGLNLALVSRRSVERDGMRLVCRGIDTCGNVANFVETEVILTHEKNSSDTNSPLKETLVRSIVITRGSIPLFWSQRRNLCWKPPIVLDSREKGQHDMHAFTKHFEKQTDFYGRQIVLNLINQTGRESVLEKIFRGKVIEHNDHIDKANGELRRKIRYIAFDFHKECGKLKLNNITKLINNLKPHLEEFYFEGILIPKSNSNDLSAESLKLQTAICRVNCMDNLDRTNLVQSIICGILMRQQLRVTLNDKRKIMSVWADNGDALSIQYSGTKALKADWTRLGKRSWSGLLSDGFKSVSRYCLNNFRDGDNQDGLNILLGKFDPKSHPGIFKPSAFGVNLIVGSISFVCVFLTLELVSLCGNGEVGLSLPGEFLLAGVVSLFCGSKLRINTVKTGDESLAKSECK